MLCSYKNSCFCCDFCSSKYKCRSLGQLLLSTPEGNLFNDVLGVPDFKLNGMILKACWPFPNETNRTRMYNFRSKDT